MMPQSRENGQQNLKTVAPQLSEKSLVSTTRSDIVMGFGDIPLGIGVWLNVASFLRETPEITTEWTKNTLSVHN